MSKICVAVVVLLCVCHTGICDNRISACNIDCDSPHWGYLDDNGVDCWGDCFPTCLDASQSPLDLDTSVTEEISVTPLTMSGYDTVQSFSMYNNGHTVAVNIGPGNEMSGLGLPSTYEAYQFHFHWGATSRTGSEHTINGRAYPMELHVVHYNTIYSSPDEAGDMPEGLAVLGFMFAESPQDNPAFEFIVSNLDQIRFENSPEILAGNQTLSSLFPDEFSAFFRYGGSLTTPPCSESVVWTVFTERILISERQLEEFRSMFVGDDTDEESVPLVDNFRPPQPRNNRTVYFGMS